MALHQLLSMIPHEVADLRRSIVGRWTDSAVTGDWEPEPDYGAFVDDEGRVVLGTAPARAFLDSDDPRHLELSPGVERSLGNAKVYFLDWARQPLSWEEIFDLWEAWESQGMVADCGSVSVAYSLSHRWSAPGWVAFRDDFDGAPLAVIPRGVPAAAPAPVETAPVGSSFLARARKLRGEPETAPEQTAQEGDLPMLPFTIDDLRDPHRVWPTGVV